MRVLSFKLQLSHIGLLHSWVAAMRGASHPQIEALCSCYWDRGFKRDLFWLHIPAVYLLRGESNEFIHSHSFILRQKNKNSINKNFNFNIVYWKWFKGSIYMPRLTFQVELFSHFLLKERKTSKAEECGAEVGQVQASAALWVNTCWEQQTLLKIKLCRTVPELHCFHSISKTIWYHYFLQSFSLVFFFLSVIPH